MKASTIQWHLARDNQIALNKFCEANRVRSEHIEPYEVEGVEGKYFAHVYYFDNGGYIKAEMRAGDDTRGYSVADHFQVIGYRAGL